MNGDSPLHLALMLKRDDIVALLLAAGADVNVPNGEGESPILVAVRYGNASGFAALLPRRLNLDRRDETERSPLFWAILENHEDMALALIQRGARTDQCSEGYTPLQLARIQDQARVVALLGGEI
ncbi:hypothetical protein GCM10027046_07240 [Uliginosibacterium flavum]|uniref:Ankyrin repeat domain-containing protein n=1 Tax=Uliginosibacterium flavum TaxID=1396831 RepID=A0ABV2TMM8_9RHOO